MQRRRQLGPDARALQWHLGYHSPQYTPQRRGFDSHYGYYTGNEEYWNHTSPCWHCGVNYTALDLHNATAQSSFPVRDKAGVYSSEVFTDAALDVLDKHDPDTPLFLYLPYESVHGAASCDPDCDMPSSDLLQAPQWAVDAQQQIANPTRRLFAGMVGALDAAVANITAKLQDKGMWEDTLFVFTTDNGAVSVACARRGLPSVAHTRPRAAVEKLQRQCDDELASAWLQGHLVGGGRARGRVRARRGAAEDWLPQRAAAARGGLAADAGARSGR